MSDEAEKAAEAWLRDKYGAYRGHPSWREIEAGYLAGYSAAQTWRGIESAPRDKLVVVRWRVDDGTYHDFDTLTEEGWERHEDSRQHAECASPAGSRMPPVNAPYTHWLPLPPSE